MTDDKTNQDSEQASQTIDQAKQDNEKKQFVTGMLGIDSSTPMRRRMPTPNTAQLGQGSQIVFNIGDQRYVLNVEEDDIVVGRAAEEATPDDPVEFDLSPFGAYQYGVSRQHAIISLIDGFVYVEDLGSTNGTRINGFQLTGHQKYRLRDGDEIEFARLRTNIRFQSK